jgi:hypothetical protein
LRQFRICMPLILIPTGGAVRRARDVAGRFLVRLTSALPWSLQQQTNKPALLNCFKGPVAVRVAGIGGSTGRTGAEAAVYAAFPGRLRAAAGLSGGVKHWQLRCGAPEDPRCSATWRSMAAALFTDLGSRHGTCSRQQRSIRVDQQVISVAKGGAERNAGFRHDGIEILDAVAAGLTILVGNTRRAPVPGARPPSNDRTDRRRSLRGCRATRSRRGRGLVFARYKVGSWTWSR